MASFVKAEIETVTILLHLNLKRIKFYQTHYYCSEETNRDTFCLAAVTILSAVMHFKMEYFWF